MKFIFPTCLMLLFLLKGFSQDFIPGNALRMIYNVKYADKTGTMFLIYEDSANYFVTARHIFSNTPNKQKVNFQILQDSIWKNIDGLLLVSDNTQIDIAVIKCKYQHIEKNALLLQTTQFTFLSDQCFFLGFPYGFSSKDNQMLQEGFPFPLIKRATFSGANIQNGVNYLILDGHNNPGFSGGPVIFFDRESNDKLKHFVAGVISSYYGENKKMMTQYGTIIYEENSGIIIATAAEHIRSIIKNQK